MNEQNKNRKVEALDRAIQTMMDLVEERPYLKKVLEPAINELEDELTDTLLGDES